MNNEKHERNINTIPYYNVNSQSYMFFYLAKLSAAYTLNLRVNLKRIPRKKTCKTHLHQNLVHNTHRTQDHYNAKSMVGTFIFLLI